MTPGKKQILKRKTKLNEMSVKVIEKGQQQKKHKSGSKQIKQGERLQKAEEK